MNIIKILGFTPDRKAVLGGFFTAHDAHGLHTDWFMPMFLEDKQCVVSIPYFCAECWRQDRDPDVVWPMLERAYHEARIPIDLYEVRTRVHALFAKILADDRKDRSCASLSDVAERLIEYCEANAKNILMEGFI
jgi:hypothetical protein